MTWNYYKCSNPHCDRLTFSGWCCIHCYYNHKALVERGEVRAPFHNSDCDKMQAAAWRRISTEEATLQDKRKYGPDEWAKHWRDWEEDENH